MLDIRPTIWEGAHQWVHLNPNLQVLAYGRGNAEVMHVYRYNMLYNVVDLEKGKGLWEQEQLESSDY